jgi:hypothetical protein
MYSCSETFSGRWRGSYVQLWSHTLDSLGSSGLEIDDLGAHSWMVHDGRFEGLRFEVTLVEAMKCSFEALS